MRLKFVLSVLFLLLCSIAVDAQNVGIGLNMPQVRLHLFDDTQSDISFVVESSDTTTTIALDGLASQTRRLMFNTLGTPEFSINHESGTLRFYTNLEDITPVPAMTLAGGKVGINVGSQVSLSQALVVNGKIKIGDDVNAASPGTIRYNSTDSTIQYHDGLAWRESMSLWSTTSDKVYYNNGAVLVGRTNIIGSERFGVRIPVSGTSYGGMYIETNGSASGRPFYGYAVDNIAKAWHYFDGATQTWRLVNGSDRISVKNSGEVGIGILDPTNRLDLSSDGTLDTTETILGLISNTSNRPVLQFSEWSTANSPYSGMSIEYDGAAGDMGENRMHIRGVDAVRKFTYKSNGNFGVGTTDPREMLEIAGDGRMFIGDGAGDDRKGLLIDAQEAGDWVRVIPYDYGTSSSMALYLPAEVNIGTTIGATNYMLSVDGKIMSEEIKVQLSGSWPDYVFDENYDLAELSEIEDFIVHHGHLPGVPSSQEVDLENGVELGEMNRILLEKIEELTLHVIEQDKVIKTLVEEVQTLKDN